MNRPYAFIRNSEITFRKFGEKNKKRKEKKEKKEKKSAFTALFSGGESLSSVANTYIYRKLS